LSNGAKPSKSVLALSEGLSAVVFVPDIRGFDLD
jgi:hypothetical protein